MSIIQLPLAKSPVEGLQYLAYILGILLYYEECLPWFYSNYIQLVWRSDFTSHLTFFPNWFSMNPWLDVQVFKKDTMKINNINIHHLITNCINSKIYFYSSFDEFYVPHKHAYGKKHFQHDFMIYGYDSIQKEYMLLGYTDKHTFETTRISFAQIEEAFFSNAFGTENVHLIGKKDNYKYDFDLQLVYEMLEDYINSRNSSERCRMYGEILTNRVFGFDVYKCMREYFNLLLNDTADFDIRPLHILYEHKKCMILRLKYMYENNFIEDCSHLYDNYRHIENEVLAMRNLQIKYAISKDKRFLNKIVDMLSKMEQKEKILIEELLGKIYNKLQKL